MIDDRWNRIVERSYENGSNVRDDREGDERRRGMRKGVHNVRTKSRGLNTEVTYIWNAWPVNANNTFNSNQSPLYLVRSFSVSMSTAWQEYSILAVVTEYRLAKTEALTLEAILSGFSVHTPSPSSIWLRIHLLVSCHSSNARLRTDSRATTDT